MGRYLGLVQAGRRRDATRFTLGLLDDGVSFEEVVESVLAPAQRQVGVCWQAGQCTVAHEHLASSVTESVLGALAARGWQVSLLGVSASAEQVERFLGTAGADAPSW